MPHISVKMLEGRNDELKQKLAENLRKTVIETLGCKETNVSVSIEDYTKIEWQGIFKDEITKKPERLIIKPQYDPKDMLK